MLAWLLLALFLNSALLNAQQRDPARRDGGSIGGRVVDAELLTPLGGVVIRLEPAGGPGSNGPGGRARSRSAVTDSAGAYLFLGLEPGRYRLHVERIGYLPRSLEVDLRSLLSTHLSVGLELGPVMLPPVEVTGAVDPPFVRTRSPNAEVLGARARAARERQAAYLAADVREITHGEVVEAVTLAEPDLFRALQRVPGVSTRDDYTATMWTRGASWDQTRVYFDGLPLFNPTHAGWLFSAVNPDAIGEALFFPGYRPGRWGEGAAAVLDLRSRRGPAHRALEGVGELSPASARLALGGEAADGALGWMVAGRRTYVDVLADLLAAVSAREDLRVPYDFADLVARVDARSASGWGVEASTILERDHLRGDIPGLIRDNEGHWGNVAGRVTLVAPIAAEVLPLVDEPTELRVSLGGTRFGTALNQIRPVTARSAERTLPSMSNSIRHAQLGLELKPTGQSRRWSLGAQVLRDSIDYSGPYSLLGILTVIGGDDPNEVTYGEDLVSGVLWADRQWAPTRRLGLETGLRVEFGDSVFNGGYVRVAPRAAARVRWTEQTSLSVAWGRSYQYAQDVSHTAGPVGPQLHLSAVWILAEDAEARPAARADVLTAGLEHWIGETWLFAASAYGRRTSGLLIPNPRPGAVRVLRDPEAVADNAARGLEVSLRRLAGRWTGSLGYSLGSSEMRLVLPVQDVAGPFPAATDIRHALDATAMLRLGRSLRMGGAFSFGSGVPFTRLVLPDTSRPADLPVLEAPNAERTPSYASLDLMLEYTRTFGSWEWSVYGQLRNALNRNNAVTYLGSRNCGQAAVQSLAGPQVGCDGVASGIKDNFGPGLPRLPLVGVRVKF